jgi:capsular exopolysaccharide synthesis family protein
MEPANFPTPSTLTEDDSIDLKRYLSLFLSNWYWFVIALFIALSVAYGINRYSQKIFSVSSTLLIKDDQNGGISNIATSVIPGGDIFKSQQNLKNEIEILKSYRLNFLVMKGLKEFHVVYVSVGRRGIVETTMYNNCPFRVDYDSLELQRRGLIVGITVLNEQKYLLDIDGKINFKTELNFGERFTKYGFDFSIEKRNPDRPVYSSGRSNTYYFYFTDPVALANQYRAKLSVSPRDKEGSLVTLSVSGFVPEQEADYLNKLMEVYINYGLEFKKQMAAQTISFINAQLDIISDSLEVAAKKLESFRMTNRFIDLKNESTIIQNRLEESDNEKDAVELQLQYYNYLLEYVNDKNANGTIVSPSVIGISDMVLLNRITELSSLQQEKEKLKLNLETNQPALKYLEKQSELIRESLKETIKNCIANINLSKDQIDARKYLNEREFSKLPSTEKKYVTIQRQFDLNNSIYTYLLEKRAESGIAQASTLPDNRTIDYAQLRGLVKPTAKKNLMIALVLGLLLPAVGLALIDFLNNKVIDRKDVIRKTKVSIIGYISHSDSKNEIPVIEKPASSLSESFRSVRTALKYYVRENKVAVIAVSSTISAEGKTFISINLASIIAMLGKKVLLIGLDLRKPRINRIFEYENSPGMSTYLSGNCEYEEIIKKTQVNNLFYAPSGPVPPNPAELIETGLMKKFMLRAKKEYDYIIFDTPPIAIVTDALLLSEYSDINLFIVRQRYTTLNTIDMIEQLNNHGELKNMAIILNDISLSGYYGYGIRYGYNRGYGYSYGTSYYGSNYYGKYGNTDNAKGYYVEE